MSGWRDSCDRIGGLISAVGLLSGVAVRRSGDAQSCGERDGLVHESYVHVLEAQCVCLVV